MVYSGIYFFEVQSFDFWYIFHSVYYISWCSWSWAGLEPLTLPLLLFIGMGRWVKNNLDVLYGRSQDRCGECGGSLDLNWLVT